MTDTARLVIVTGLPGSGKSTTAKWLAKFLLVTWIYRFITRPFRKGEKKGTENLRISDKEFLRLKKAHKLFHPTETEIPHWGKHYRGFPVMSTWIPLSGTDIMLVVPGPRAALEILDQFPDAVAVFLTAPREILVQRIRDRGDAWGTSNHPKKILEYDTMYGGLGIESEFERRGIPVIDTNEVDPEAVARRILSMLGVNPLKSKFMKGDSESVSSP